MNSTTISATRTPCALAALGAALVGAIARLLVYGRGLSLWNDEAMIALNIGRRGLPGLLRPLDYDQAAPVLYLWMARIATWFGGVNEYTLRFPAFIAAVLFPFALWFIGRRIVGDAAAMVATILAALSPLLITYGNQVKPYSSDALVALLVAWLAWRVREQPTNRGAWIALAFGGVAAILFSYTAVFALVACGILIVGTPGLLKTAGVRMPLFAAAVWAVGGLAVYVLFMRAAASSAYLHFFWANTFMTSAAGSLSMRAFLAARAFMAALPLPIDLLRPRLLLPFYLIGFAVLWRMRGWATAAMCIAPLLAVTVASAAERYPMSGRLMLFVAPFVLLVMGVAVAALLSPLEKRITGATAVVALLLPVAILNSRLTRFWRIQATTEGRGAVEAIASARGHEPVYVAPAAVPLWAFYSTDWSHPDTRYLDSVATLASSGGIAFSGAPSRKGPVKFEEGRTLTFQRNGALELIGVNTGNPYFAGADLSKAQPDSGWAQTEASRMLATCGDHLWIMSAVRVGSETPPLVQALRSAGARVVYRFDELQASALRMRMPATRPVSCAPPPAVADGH